MNESSCSKYRVTVLLAMILLLGLSLSGCGQTGPLYLPPPEQEEEKN